MRYDRKGMAAVIDAFIFITVLGLVAAGMFIHTYSTDDRDATARTLHDAFFSIELKTNDLFDETDSQTVRICDLLAAYMVTGAGNAEEYAKEVLDAIIPPVYDYLLLIEYDGRVLTIGNGGDIVTSKYSAETQIISGKGMRSTLSLY